MSSTYPHDYIEWCFGEANNISEYTKVKQLVLMEEQQAYYDMIAEREAPPTEGLGNYYQHHHEQAEPVPAHQVLTDRLTTLLEA